MTNVPVIPDSAPFTLEQRAWLNGYLAGLFSRGAVQPAAAIATAGAKPAAVLAPLTILFGSQTGTSETLAKRAAKEAGKRGYAATPIDMGGFTADQLAQEQNVLVITSTYGDGEPPDNAKALHAALTALAADAAHATKLNRLRFSVCALGDTNYIQFCRAGKEFDAMFEKLGGRRVAPIAECDLDYEAKFTGWLSAALTGLGEGAVAGSSAAAGTVSPIVAAEVEAGSAFSRTNPYPALLLASHNLNAPGSGKQVHHVEFDLGDAGLVYEAGDALGVYAHNCPELVADVLAALGCDGEEAVSAPDGTAITLRRALTEFYDLGKPSPELLALYSPMLAGRTGEAPSTPPHHVVDALLGATSHPTPAEFVKVLKKLQPRLYSISSSPRAHSGRVHLTVGAVRYETAGRARKGVCSTFLADRAQPGVTRIGVFVHSNKAFRPPTDGDKPMIMVGPGTGIAPFRGFLHERRAAGAKGKNWLFFGDQRASTDFLYRDELAELQSTGVLTRLDTAFSRDQSEKIYVQHRMLEQAKELFTWLEEGAHFYVCGDASRMAKDVDVALHRVIELAGGRTPEQAAAYVQNLKTTKRYARDVY